MMFGLQNTDLINQVLNIPHKAARNFFRYGLSVFGCIVLLTSVGCENSLKQIQEISAKELEKPVERTIGVDVIYSDSARVKARMSTPILLQYNTGTPKAYSEMPNGVKVIVFDKSMQPNSTITSEYAITKEDNKVIELRRNVVAKNDKGDVFKSEELIWNQLTGKVTSSKPVTITSADGSVIYGNGLETNQKFDPWTIPNTTGKINMSSNLSQQ
ncbi:LPS export ABC transporter periplasmic protein LptC [Mucilaginibacter sp. Bleaf8]|uniref:LPS export ABC transporter periplasmic protein LptC n=1 Tax=Mucilaginibacter sp. Bleaf8 TaxID=2834430 RepID=UPI001BCD4408|nr:LPS export ABC transporter periplasmic protein LptC [Mucilaginibacter sp. Bleaf8]MBS7566572.1 LPS export ABC transporter periplasmic protein LptC [Mucilaginibacter sp. Bleaf8]